MLGHFFSSKNVPPPASLPPIPLSYDPPEGTRWISVHIAAPLFFRALRLLAAARTYFYILERVLLLDFGIMYL